MPWTDDYIGLPFKNDGRDRGGLDCWGLVRLVYHERLGIVLPSYDGIFVDESRRTLTRIGRLMEEQSALWRQVDKPAEYDVVLMRVGRLFCHVGIFVPPRDVLHIMEGIESVREPLTGIRKNHQIVGYFRHG